MIRYFPKNFDIVRNSLYSILLMMLENKNNLKLKQNKDTKTELYKQISILCIHIVSNRALTGRYYPNRIIQLE